MPDAHGQTLAALVERRRHLVGRLTAEKNRHQPALPAMRPYVQAHIAGLEQALQDRDTELDQTLQASPLWREREQLLRRMPGIGPVVRSRGLPSGSSSGKVRPSTSPRWSGWPHAIATAAPGAAPARCGAAAGTCGPRRQGRPVAVRRHLAPRAFSERLVARGKPKKLALTACMHKRLTILHALLRQHTPWQPVPAT